MGEPQLETISLAVVEAKRNAENRSEDCIYYYGLLEGHPGDYTVSVPDLVGCCASGHDRDEALRNVILAATELIAEMEPEYIGEPTSIEALSELPTVIKTLEEGGVFVVVPTPKK